MATNMATFLLHKGYIEKKQSLTDRRSFCLVPTNQAIRLVEDMYEEYFKKMSILGAKMGETDFDVFVRLLEKANEILLEAKNNG